MVLAILAAERLIELRIARRNFKELLSRGGIEIGAEHYPWIVILHLTFFASLAIEELIRQPMLPVSWPIFGVLFAVSQVLRVWVLLTLGRRWTTRVVVVPEEKLIHSGPYRLLRHPNYAVVALELAAMPLIFGLYWTAAIFSILNVALLLFIRIPVEESALRRFARYLPRSQ